jgi:tetratricopeptide (TPR) repeat protein
MVARRALMSRKPHKAQKLASTERTGAAAESPTAVTPLRRLRTAGMAAAIALAVLIVAGIARFAGLLGAAPLPPPREVAAAPLTPRNAFVGATACKECHVTEFAAWERSTHGRAGGAPSDVRVIAAFNGPPMRFRDATVTPRVANGRYKFVVAQNDEPVRVIIVDGVVGGGHMEGGGTQGFVTRRPDGTVRFVPFDWSRQGNSWFCNTNSRANKGWVPITPALALADCGDWPPVRVLGDLPRYANCQSCHASQLTVTLDTARGGWHTESSALNINCEACHGPGQRHIGIVRERTASGAAPHASADIGYSSLATLRKDASLDVCFQCHAVKDRLRGGHMSGDSLAAFYSLAFPSLGDRPLTEDGRSRTFAYQEGHRYSDCYLNGGMTCTSCHDPHTQGYRDVNGAPLPGRFDDRQCTSCHAAKAAAPSQHTHHAPASVGSRCTSCHMPYVQQHETGRGAVRYARSDHTISIPRPEWDAGMGVRNACLGCHADKSNTELEQASKRWWGTVKPLKSVIASEVKATVSMSADEAWPLLLGVSGDTLGDRHRAARFDGLARFMERYVRPESPLPRAAAARLRELAKHADPDVQALALAALHLGDSENWSSRRTMSTALKAVGAHDGGLRARWSLALGFMGDRFNSAQQLDAASTAYRRALEISPRDARIWLNLAAAERDAGDVPSAITHYQRSLSLDGAQPIAYVNLGIAQQAAGDTAAAMRAWQRAAALDPGEALAPFNTANAELARGRLPEARALFQRAVELDGSLAAAYFQIARIAILQGDGPGAVGNLRRGLRFDSTNVAAREALARIQAAGR